MASRSDISQNYSGKDAAVVKQGQTDGKSFGMNPQPKGTKSDAPNRAVGGK